MDVFYAYLSNMWVTSSMYLLVVTVTVQWMFPVSSVGIGLWCGLPRPTMYFRKAKQHTFPISKTKQDAFQFQKGQTTCLPVSKR